MDVNSTLLRLHKRLQEKRMRRRLKRCKDSPMSDIFRSPITPPSCVKLPPHELSAYLSDSQYSITPEPSPKTPKSIGIRRTYTVSSEVGPIPFKAFEDEKKPGSNSFLALFRHKMRSRRNPSGSDVSFSTTRTSTTTTVLDNSSVLGDFKNDKEKKKGILRKLRRVGRQLRKASSTRHSTPKKSNEENVVYLGVV
ncbi:unnamed protein product [Dimorphilus gyrociliatus]|uniref:Uncharacterized protein n=1 Tax=Dimorphilus gyrociliatus TaxID=2664684 RepID=A0A7I8V823_9ANNE|nr:unnamed protein product [Dimorphilus gyrociliatus]